VKPLDGISQLGWEEQRVFSGPDLRDSCEDSALLTLNRPQSLAEAERLLDELTQEKLQVGVAASLCLCNASAEHHSALYRTSETRPKSSASRCFVSFVPFL